MTRVLHREEKLPPFKREIAYLGPQFWNIRTSKFEEYYGQAVGSNVEEQDYFERLLTDTN